MCKAGYKDKHLAKDTKISKLISFIPRGGRFYNEEPLKGFYYLITSIFITPYFTAFEDAKQTME